MKKTYLMAAAALMTLTACNKSETVVVERPDSNEIGFRVMSQNVTKAGEITGISLPNTYGIYAAATQKSAEGVTENPTYFASPYEQLFGTAEADPSGINTAAAVADARLWHAGSYASTFTPSPIYWPMGKVKMDFLAYAIPMASHQDTGLATGVWSATWDNPSTDVASQFTFNDVNTYVNQVDVMYASANDQTNAANGGSAHSTAMSFKHAQALLIFNVKVNAEVNNLLKIVDIEFIKDARLAALQKEQRDGTVPEALEASDVSLLTVGDFIVNNQRNDLQASWTGMSSTAAGYRMPVTAIAAPSASNNVVLGQTATGGDALIQQYGANIPFNGYDDDSDAETPDVSMGYAQLGETLLVPQQPKVNFVIKYQMGGRTMYYKYNELRGVWEMGKKYIYNLDINLNEIVITESVDNFVDAALSDITLN